MTDINDIHNKDQLLDYIGNGHCVKYLCFWGHQNNKDGSITKACLSQWYPTVFALEGHQYPTAEHYMMAEKARLLNDEAVLEKILKAKHPSDAKKLGRAIKSYDEVSWREHRFDIVVRGNLGKFSQNEALKTFLINTGDRVLVEASPRDKIWGIGMGQSNPDAENPFKWKGLNILGFALMAVRNELNKL